MLKIVASGTLTLLFLWFHGGSILSHVVSIAIEAFIGYGALFLLCQRIMDKGIEKGKYQELDDMFKDFNITGIVRVILTSFNDFGEMINIKPYFVKIWSQIVSNNNQQKNTKPYIKTNKEEDVKTISNALLSIMENKNKNGTTYKELVENNFSDKWGYFYHARYIGNILGKINDVCLQNNLRLIGILVHTNDGGYGNGFFNYVEKNNITLPNGINRNSKITDDNVQEYIRQAYIDIKKYKECFDKL